MEDEMREVGCTHDWLSSLLLDASSAAHIFSLSLNRCYEAQGYTVKVDS